MAESGYKIGEIAERTGISLPTLRHYDSVGLVSPSHRSPGGFRLYSEEDLHRILLVRRMKPLGFTLEDMRSFLEAANSSTPAARETVARVQLEARTRYEKLSKQLAYAEEFLDIVDNLA